MNTKRWLILILAIAIGLLLALINPFGLSANAANTIGIGIGIIILWLGEAVSLAVASLLPLILFPLTGIMDLKSTAVFYANPVIFLFLGGFFLGLAIEKWNLHIRIALNIILITGTGLKNIVLGFMLATALLSMWISNTATAMLMLPIALSVINLVNQEVNIQTKSISNFSVCVLLGVAYGASIGGVGTLIGTPPNVIMTAYMKDLVGFTPGFFQWMLIGVPYASILLILGYFILTHVVFPCKQAQFEGGRAIIKNKLDAIGKISTAEIRTLLIFVFTAMAWIARTQIQKILPEINDTIIAMSGGLLLFFVPANKKEMLLEWTDTKKVAWGILFLFGGGLALAGAMYKYGIVQTVAANIVNAFGGSGILLILVFVVAALALTEMMSNTALVTIFIPVVVAVAAQIDMPVMQLVVPVTLVASAGFMLPVSTPPNAIVYSSGILSVKQMFRGGVLLNFIAILLSVIFGLYVVPIVF